ncbi:hypothetical protein PVAND_017630 [Polypedilum vanderplanki]|uniref:Integrase catalytic domain-containing protein n=1 Tax=Polypedilum vanderplanki TaxID=319348 RepID=A0A9J6B8Q0_POLVA|nr:hypothetical protein PVAND_017630 [Polypedilum vanderplanki]
MAKKIKDENPRSRIVNELYKESRINYPRRRVEIKGLNDLLSVDLGDLSRLKKYNNGYAYFLLAVNAFSKKIWTVPLKTKTGKEVAKAMVEILSKCGHKFKNYWTDLGSEFFNQEVQKKVVKAFNLNHYTTHSIKKSVFSERYIKTVKVNLFRSMDLRGTNKWVDKLSEITQKINLTPHSRYGFIPEYVTEKDEAKIKKIYETKRALAKKIKFKIGDVVRISDIPKIFARRAWKTRWSASLYTIFSVNKKFPPVYKIKDWKGRILKKSFYESELMKTKYPDVWLVDKVLKYDKKKKKVLVRYVECGSSGDEWVNEKQVYDVEE